MEAGWHRKALAEIIGTFTLVFAGGAAIIHTSGGDLVVIALAHGLAIGIMVTAFGRISGGHFNPAVTVGALVGRKIRGDLAAAYVGAQVLAAVLAALALWVIWPAKPFNLGTQDVGAGFTVAQAVVAEVILTFFLVTAVFATGVDPKGAFGAVGGFAIGLTVAMDILAGGPVSGASMNPARSFGPALVSWFWNNHWVYWLAPVVGGAIAGIVYSRVFLDPEDR